MRLTNQLFTLVRYILSVFLIILILVTYSCQEAKPSDTVVDSIEPKDYGKPNILMIVVDDLRFDEFGAGGHPYLKTPNIDRLASDGAMFSNAYHATPLCSPNRASILTGQYASRHGILDNTSRSESSHRLDLFPKDLQAAGYTTAHVGKWHMGNDPTPRPGYDYWVSFVGQGKAFNPDLYEQDHFTETEGYMTDIFTDRTIDFINSTQDKPFFAYIGHKAVHPSSVQRNDGSIDLENKREFLPAKRHVGIYAGQVIERAPSHGFNDKNSPQQQVLKEINDFKNSPEIQDSYVNVIDNGVSEKTVQNRAEMVLAIDEGLGRLMDVLESLGKLDNTLILFTSDNGYFYGEHGLTTERRLPYQEAIKAPLLMHYPKLIPAGTYTDAKALSIDFAPTILELAGIGIPSHIQGESLVPILTGKSKKVHDSILIEYYSHENPFRWTVDTDYRAVIKDNHKYIKWLRHEGKDELYDLTLDPFELNNVIDDADKAAILDDMKQDMKRLVLESMSI